MIQKQMTVTEIRQPLDRIPPAAYSASTMTDRPDCVYFILESVTQTIKIGVSADPESRMLGLQANTPLECSMIRYVKVEDGYLTEHWLHEKFQHLRVRGEWFRLTPELLDFAKNADFTALQPVRTPPKPIPPIESRYQYTITLLAQKTGITERTIRYYIAEGLLPKAAIKGRAANYGAEHLSVLLKIRELKAQGLSMFQIRPRILEDRTGIWVTHEIAHDVLVTTLNARNADLSVPRARYIAEALAIFANEVKKAPAFGSTPSTKENA